MLVKTHARLVDQETRFKLRDVLLSLAFTNEIVLAIQIRNQ
jgi:hypothetical protein